MRKRASAFLVLGPIVALLAMLPVESIAASRGDSGELAQHGEDRWVPSLAFVAGFTIQSQQGTADSNFFEDSSPTSVPLRGFFEGDDLAFTPFVGASLELMTPTLPLPTKPRLFLGGEFLPTFGSLRDLAFEGVPGCLKGPEFDDICAVDEDGSRKTFFPEDSLNGQGTRMSAQIDTYSFAASLGAAFPFEFSERQFRLKLSVGWINYGVEAKGLVVDGSCNPTRQCTDYTSGGTIIQGFLRETTLMASASQSFNGLGPGLEVEMDTGRFGPLGASIFLGARAYRILGDRTITFDTSLSFDDTLGNDRASAAFEFEVKPWMFRAHVGFRLHWLGNRE